MSWYQLKCFTCLGCLGLRCWWCIFFNMQMDSWWIFQFLGFFTLHEETLKRKVVMSQKSGELKHPFLLNKWSLAFLGICRKAVFLDLLFQNYSPGRSSILGDPSYVATWAGPIGLIQDSCLSVGGLVVDDESAGWLMMGFPEWMLFQSSLYANINQHLSFIAPFRLVL